jgi:hypothetical protein
VRPSREIAGNAELREEAGGGVCWRSQFHSLAPVAERDLRSDSLGVVCEAEGKRASGGGDIERRGATRGCAGRVGHGALHADDGPVTYEAGTAPGQRCLQGDLVDEVGKPQLRCQLLVALVTLVERDSAAAELGGCRRGQPGAAATATRH